MMIPFGCVHSSTVIKYHGETLVTFFAGSKEGQKDVQIWIINVTENRLRQITNDHQPNWNPVLFEWKDELYIAYKHGRAPWDWVTHIANIDDELNPFFTHTVDGGPVKNKPIIMSNGELIAGHSTESVGSQGWKCYASILERSEWLGTSGYHLDARETWTNIPIDSSKIQGQGVIQPTLWESKPGAIHMMMRSAMGKICRADSEDYGRSWCPAYPTDLPNNNSGIDVVDVGPGSLYLVSNPVLTRNINSHNRSPLTIHRSDDNGHTWNLWQKLESGPGEYSYPAIVHDPDTNSLLVSYTYKKHSIKLRNIPLGANEYHNPDHY